MYIHFMPHPESSCLIKLTSSESSTISDEEYLFFIFIKIVIANNTAMVHYCKVKAVFIENDVTYYQLSL